MNELLKSLHQERMSRMPFREQDILISRENESTPLRLTLAHKPGLAIGSSQWPCGILTSEFLLGSLGRSLVKNKTCIELGAGLGLVGICAMHAGAKNALLTDRHDLIEILRLNASRSEFKSIQCHELDWSIAQDESLIPLHDFDIVLGADLVYCSELFESLARTIVNNLKPNSGMLILGYSPRRPQEEAVFFELLANHGLDEISRHSTNADSSSHVRIFAFSPARSSQETSSRTRQQPSHSQKTVRDWTTSH